MERLQKCGVVSWMTPVIVITMIFLAGCSRITPEPQIQTVTQIQKTTIPVVARPKPVQLTDTRVFVVTKDNLDSFLEEFSAAYGEVAFVALSMKDYENLALNIAEIRRYLNQQTEIIIYYEKAVKDNEK